MERIMSISRREFLAGTAAVAAAASPAFARVRPAAAESLPRLGAETRALFPWSTHETFLNSAAYHPISIMSMRAMEEYLGYRLNGAPADLDDVGASGRGTGGAKQDEVKALFGRLINARPTEIAFVQSTSDGESIVVSGMALTDAKGSNVVIDELHYGSAVYMYQRLEKEHGLELRIVKPRDGAIDIRDIEKAVDKKTKLVSMAFVSNINGYVHDVKAISDVAHANGAYVYADVIQAAGCVPIDVKAIGLDMCACSSYKWLMGERGFGFLYIREDLQGSLVKSTRYGHRQVAQHNPAEKSWTLEPGGAQYETGNVSNVAVAGVHESLKYILGVGVPNIRTHVRPLTERLQKEMPALGFPPLTPRGNESPIVVFLVKDGARVSERLRQAKVAVTVGGGRIRIAPTVFNTNEDIDKLLGALAS
jgi:selenocysteine lyase/cysteine desulfurase